MAEFTAVKSASADKLIPPFNTEYALDSTAADDCWAETTPASDADTEFVSL
jgi:hypothetical protein